MSDERIPVRDDLVDLVPYGAPQLDVPVRLNTNETAEPPPEGYLEEVGRRIQSLSLNRYPDRPHRELRQKLAERFDVDPTGVWAANGSNEILMQLFQAYGGPGRRAVGVRPGYSMYPVIARVTLTELLEADLDNGFRWTPSVIDDVADLDPDLTIVANPNNPTGVAVPLDHVEALHHRTSGLVVIDEAYVEFGGASAVALLGELPRLVIVRTFSKAFRLAGLRLGYLVARPWVIDDVRRVRLPYHLDALKQVAAIVALEQEDAFLEHRQRVADERERVAEAMSEIAAVQVWPSAGNFLLFRTEVADLFDRLLNHGVLVRDFSDKPRLRGCLRVTIGTVDENDAFLDAMRRELSA